MNLIASFLIVLFSVSPAPWLTNFQKAKGEAAQEHKYILLSFSGSDWCVPCIHLHKAIFESEAFENYAAKNLVLVNADFPRLKKNRLTKEQTKQNEALADQYNSKGVFPLTLLLDTNGNIVKRWEGFPDEVPEKFVDEINNAVPHANP